MEFNMSIFLTYVEFTQKLTNEKVNELSRYANLKTYSKSQVIFTESDFPLEKIFIVKSGQVELKKQIVVETNNFIPINRYDYQRLVE